MVCIYEYIVFVKYDEILHFCMFLYFCGNFAIFTFGREIYLVVDVSSVI